MNTRELIRQAKDRRRITTAFAERLIRAIRNDTEGDTAFVTHMARERANEVEQASDAKERIRLAKSLVSWLEGIFWGDAHAGQIIDFTQRRIGTKAYPYHDQLIAACPLCERSGYIDPIWCTATHQLKIISGLASSPIEECIWLGLHRAGEKYGNYLSTKIYSGFYGDYALTNRPVHDFRDALHAHEMTILKERS